MCNSLVEFLLEIHQVLVEPFSLEILLNKVYVKICIENPRVQLNLPQEEELVETQQAEATRRAEEAQLADIARRAKATQLAATLVDRNRKNTPSHQG
ncbi:hypothetical protein HAX54_024934 [Datura stramonium]|uniref:Uncharacterized protein n=1 Tax=Datura stramonium TaxID=4076 RepID=A0ABS8UYN4_DATST|nr:hypothetical protein [Datura stramonium]